MDVFKLTFETTIVGISAFLWIGIAIDLISPTFLVRLKAVAAEANQTLTAAVLLSCAYCLGSAILPISGQLVNDEHWPVREEAIRCRVAMEENKRVRSLRQDSIATNFPETDPSNCDRPYLDRLFNRQPGTSTKPRSLLVRNSGKLEEDRNEAQRAKVLIGFELAESSTLGQGAEKEELFKQMRERVTVLRGAFFSGLVASWICVFACIAPQPHERYRRARKIVGLVLALFLMLLLICSAHDDLTNRTIFDLPILEAVLISVTVFGGFLVLKGVRRPCFLRVRFLIAIVLCAALSYGGWIWSEVLYDRQVISSSALSEAKAEHPAVKQVHSGKSALSTSQTTEDDQAQIH